MKSIGMFNSVTYFISIFSLIFTLSVYAEGKMNADVIQSTEEAIFAMGCFWCGESEFKNHATQALLPGIVSITVGYAGGTIANPTYEHHPGYKEAIKIEFEPNIISYEKLLNIFWHNIDPLDEKGQFCDKGFAYTSAIFFVNPTQKALALSTKAKISAQLNKDVKTEIIPYTTFYDAEGYHQNYKVKNPVRYTYYRWSCGRDQRLKELWGEKSDKD